ncbi:hypothetical protein CBS101457_001899 [Exobasidium rhododendri]|nr:hypothetical protein CBS101457_001899 [Exobasidium rhododendri]
MLRSYENFLLHNASQITAVESTLRSVTYFLPGRFPDSDLAGEAVYSALNLLGLYHDSILVRLLSPSPLPRSLGPPSTTNDTDSSLSQPSSSTLFPPATYSKLQHTPSSHARYTHHFADSSQAYNTVARALVIVNYTELLAEMVARRRMGQKNAWNVVVGIESLKAALRLALLHLSGNRPTIQPPIPEREVDPAMLEEDRKAALQSMTESVVKGGDSLEGKTEGGTSNQEEFWRGTRTGFARPTLSSIRSRPESAATPILPDRNASRTRHPLTTSQLLPDDRSASNSESDSDETLVDSWTEKDVNDFLLSRTLTPNDVRQPRDLVRTLKGSMGYTAEMIWIMRPLLYVLALRRWGRKHWTPFMLSLTMEFLARLTRLRSFKPVGNTPSTPSMNPLIMAMMGENPVLGLLSGLLGIGQSASAKEARPISDVEKVEWEKRNRAFWWYILRGPIWHSYTRPRLDSIVKRTQNRPLLGIIGGFIGDYLPLVDEYYYYSAT